MCLLIVGSVRTVRDDAMLWIHARIAISAIPGDREALAEVCKVSPARR